jgi:hypothetical protein
MICSFMRRLDRDRDCGAYVNSNSNELSQQICCISILDMVPNRLYVLEARHQKKL